MINYNKIGHTSNLPFKFGGGGVAKGLAGLIAVVVILLGFPIWFLSCWLINVNSDEIAVLVRKTGKNLPPGEIIATEPDQKGIQPEVLAEGWHIRNPYTWGWEKAKITDIPAGKLGVLIRLYGKDLEPGKIIASEGYKGIVKEVLRPGKYRINPYAYMVEIYDAITIKPGSVGVVVHLTGDDVITVDIPSEKRNDFLVDQNMKGVQRYVLDPGTYYLNPYLMEVVEVTLQSQRFEMSGEDSITFLTSDGFNINVEGTIEYALNRQSVPMITHQVGDMDDVLKKIILPRARGFSRIEGSKHPAKNFITGDTRQQFQNNLENHLRKLCSQWGIDIRSVLIRNITPPDEIASIIRDREVAVQTAKKYEQQIEQAKSQAELTKQEMLAQQNKAKVEADTARIKAVIKAQQEQAVKLIAANRELEVAKLENEASIAQSEAIMLKADADRAVIKMKNEAEADVFAAEVKAYGSGMNFARQIFYSKIGPKVESILSDDSKESMGGMFLPYIPDGKEVQK